MFVQHENQKLYLKPWEYNACRIMSALANVVTEKGGVVDCTYQRTALICDASAFDEATITFIPKPNKDIARKEHYRPISLMSIGSQNSKMKPVTSYIYIHIVFIDVCVCSVMSNSLQNHEL